MGKTKITWATDTWNPVTGCSPVSAGCANCYARRMALRFPKVYPRGFDVHIRPERFGTPLRWQRPRMIFVCSMGDLFHEDVTVNVIGNVLNTIAECPHHTFLVLTKRPERMREELRVWARLEGSPIPNLWAGVTAENQETADERIPILLDTPAAKRFISVEPMLGPVDLGSYYFSDKTRDGRYPFPMLSEEDRTKRIDLLDLVIAGGESGPRARPAHPDWFRLIRDQCVVAGVPFHFKQWGEWAPATLAYGVQGHVMPDTGEKYTWIGWDGTTQNPSWHGLDDPVMAIARVGRNAAGRELDGRTWDEMPSHER